MRPVTMAVIAAVFLCSFSPARADDRKEIEGLYTRLRHALLTNHLDDTLSMETPDFRSKGMDGKVQTGPELVKQMKMEASAGTLKQMDIKIVKMAVKGKNADVTTSFMAGSDSKDAKGKTHKLGMTGSIHNTLVKTAAGWKFKTMEQKAGGMTIDGHPFDPSKMGGGPPKKK